MEWNDNQKQAVDEILLWAAKSTLEPVISLTGAAGTGKTTILSAVKPFLEGKSVAWCGMTGKAAVRLSQVNKVSATTLHKILYAPPSQRRDSLEFNSIATPKNDFVIVDEASMMSPKVFEDLQAWVRKGVRFLLIGDGYQLPPVMSYKETQEYGEDFSVFSRVSGPELTEVMRSDDEIIRVATELRTTFRIPREGNESYSFKRLDRPGNQAVNDFLEHPNDHAIITWRNQLRMLANASIRKKLGYKGALPQEGEPVMCCRNGQEVMNGEIFKTRKFSTGPKLGDVETNWFATEYGGVILSSTVGRDQKMDGFMPNIENWKAYHAARRSANVKIPIPVTYGYVYTAHKCVHPDTLVEVDEGLLKISEISDHGMIATPYGVKEYIDHQSNPSGTMLRITTKDGYALDVTPDHGVFVWDGEFYSRIEARNVRAGQYIQFGLFAQCDPSELSKTPEFSDKLDVRAVRYRLPLEVDEELAEFLGLFVADGTLFQKGFRLAKRHVDVVNRFQFLCEHLFDAKVSRVDVNGTPAAEVHSVMISRWLGSFGGVSPHKKGVPDVIRRSPLRIQAKFIRGLFEDGGVNINRGGKVDHIEFSSSSPGLPKMVQVMLLRFGIISARRGDRVYIYGQNAKRFETQCGFISEFKNSRLSGEAGDETKYSVPISKNEIDKVRLFLSKSDVGNATFLKRISRKKANDLMSVLPDETKDFMAEKLRWHHSPIASIERIEDSPSMCVTVPSCGRFMQDGSPQSNSQGSEFDKVTIFLDSSDTGNPHFRKDTKLPDGSTMPFASRWLYSALTRAKSQVTLLIGN